MVAINTDQNILWLDVCVDYGALCVEVVEALQHLLHHDLDVGQWDSLVVTPDYELEQVVAKHLEHRQLMELFGFVN